MSEITHTVDRAEKADRLMTVASGWAAILLGIFGIHRWVAVGSLDSWVRGSLILALGCAIMWVWGYWAEITTRLRAWVRGGGLNTTAIAVGLVLSLIVVNTLVRRRVVMKMDLTQNQRFTLSPQSREIVKRLEQPVTATVFIPAGRNTSQARDLFKQYADASDKFQWSHVDPLVDQKTLLAKQPRLDPVNFTGAVLEYGEKNEKLSEFTEKAISSAILKLTRDTRRRILFLEGHGEPDINAPAGNPAESVGLIVEQLKAQQWDLATVDLYRKDAKVPDPADTAALVIAGPEKELAPIEAQRVKEFLNKGGSVLLALDTQGPAYTQFLKEWGIDAGDRVVFGSQQNSGLLVVSADASAHEAVKTARRVVFPPMRAVSAASPAPTGITVTELLNSGPDSEVVSNYVPGRPVDTRSARPGPAGLLVMAEKQVEGEKKARLIVAGGADWLSDQWTSLPFFNQALGSGLVNYLAQEEALVSIPPKDENTEQAFLTPEQGPLLLLIHFADFPLLALGLAILVYLKRR